MLFGKHKKEEQEESSLDLSEFEKKEVVDTNQIAALIDKAKEIEATEKKDSKKITQSNQKNSFATGLTLSEEDALRAQIFGCWSVQLGLPYDQNLLVRIKLQLKKDGTIMKLLFIFDLGTVIYNLFRLEVCTDSDDPDFGNKEIQFSFALSTVHCKPTMKRPL